MKNLIFIVLFTYSACIAQNAEDTIVVNTTGYDLDVDVEEVITLMDAKKSILVLPSESLEGMKTVEVKSEYFDKLKKKAIIIQYNISALDASGKVLFMKNPRGKSIPETFINKYKNCDQCKSIRIDKIRIAWGNDGSYTLRKRKEWVVTK